MRALVTDFDLRTPSTLQKALELLATSPGEWRPFAGGTDLMVQFESGKLSHNKFVSLQNFSELKGIQANTRFLAIGALCTYAEIQEHPIVASEFELLIQAGKETGAIAIQNRGTLGGNIANASPAADSPPCLLVYEAELEILSASRPAKRIPYSEFHLGYKQTQLRADEIISQIFLPRPSSDQKAFSKSYFRKVGTRNAQAISKVSLAALALLKNQVPEQIRLALGSVAPYPLRAFKTENLLRGQRLTPKLIADAQAELERDIAPIDDIRSNSAFRRKVARNLLEEFCETLCGIG